MRRFILSTIPGAALLGLLSAPPEANAQRMMQMSPPARMQPSVRMQSPFAVPQGFNAMPRMPYQMPAYPMSSYPMQSYQMPGYQMPGYEMSTYQQGGAYDSYGDSQYPSNAQTTSVVDVGVYDDLFMTSSIAISMGTTVEWKNYGRHHHTVISDDGTWGSDELETRGSYSHTFAQPGTYHYYCRMHMREMRGTIVVR